MANCHTSDRAPANIGAFQSVHQPHDVIGTADSLPIVELLPRHPDIVGVHAQIASFPKDPRAAPSGSRHLEKLAKLQGGDGTSH